MLNSSARRAGQRDTLWVGIATLLFHGAVARGVTGPGDFGKYSTAARQILAGELGGERLVDFSPLYLRLSVVAEALSDRLPVSGVELIFGLQIFLAAGIVAGVHHLCRERLGRVPALVAAAILAFDPRLLVYERISEPEVLLLALLVGSVVLLECRGRPLATAMAAGLLAAAAVATRPTFLPLFLLVPVYFRLLGLRRRRSESESPKCWRRRSVAFLLPFLLGSSVVWLSPGPTMNPGTVYFEGNHPLSRGTTAVYPPLLASMMEPGGVESPGPDPGHLHYRRVARFAEPTASPARVNAIWSGRARAFQADRPRVAVGRSLDKLGYAFHGFGWHDISSAAGYEARLPVPHLPTACLAALALFGMLVEARCWRRALPFYALLGVQLAVMVVFYVSERQRMVLLPAWVYFAAAALVAWTRSGDRTRRIVSSALALLLAASLSLRSDAMRDEAYRQAGQDRLVEAAMAPVELVAATPWKIDARRFAWIPQEPVSFDEKVARTVSRMPISEPRSFDLAHLFLRLRETAAARTLLEPLVQSRFRAYRGGRGPSDPRILLARLETAEGRPEKARTLLDDVLTEVPGDAFALAERAALARAADDVELASADVERLDRYWGSADRRWLLGPALRRHGLATAAVDELAPLARHLPEHRELRLRLALALADAGEVDDAAEEILAANALGDSPVIEVAAVAEIARRWAGAHPVDPRVQVFAARILHQHGFPSRALQLLDALLASPEVSLTPEERRFARTLRSHVAAGRPGPSFATPDVRPPDAPDPR